MAMKICGMHKSDGITQNFPAEVTKAAKAAWLDKIATDIVNACWEEPEKERLLLAAEGISSPQNTK